MKKILIMGLPGSGKTTLAKMIAGKMKQQGKPVVHFNADEVRENINKDLGFSVQDRIENARRFSWLADTVVKGNAYCICDFVCPIPETREAFSPDVTIFVNTIETSRFADTNKMFIKPSEISVIEITSWFNESSEDLDLLISKLL